jgi:hypothetical protein
VKKLLKLLSISLLLSSSLFGLSSLAFADASLDFEVTSVGYENGVMKAVGNFKNTGDKSIDTVNKVDVKIFLYNDQDESKQVADHYFTDLKMNLKPNEEIEYTLEFPDVPEYTDATKWSAEEGEWDYTYIEDASKEASLDFVITGAAYEDGKLKATGTFKNTGGKNIEAVQKVGVKIFLHNDQGDSKQVADQYFTDLPLHLKPGEELEYSFEFTDVPEYTDATQWSAEEGDWEFTYFE